MYIHEYDHKSTKELVARDPSKCAMAVIGVYALADKCDITHINYLFIDKIQKMLATTKFNYRSMLTAAGSAH